MVEPRRLPGAGEFGRSDDAEDVRTLLSYDEHTAGGLMTTEPVILTPETTVAEATRMRGLSYWPRSSCGAAQTSTVEPGPTAAGSSVALCTTTVVVRRPAASPMTR